MECNKPTQRNPDGRTGTWNGYYAHRNAGEPPCPECAEAARQYSRQAAKKRYYDRPEDRRAKYSRLKSKRRGVRMKPYTGTQLTETFGAVCHLCEHEVDFEIPPGNPTAATVDHPVRLAYTFGPGDQLSNARWAHERCQQRRMNRSMGASVLPFPPPKELKRERETSNG